MKINIRKNRRGRWGIYYGNDLIRPCKKINSDYRHLYEKYIILKSALLGLSASQFLEIHRDKRRFDRYTIWIDGTEFCYVGTRKQVLNLAGLVALHVGCRVVAVGDALDYKM